LSTFLRCSTGLVGFDATTSTPSGFAIGTTHSSRVSSNSVTSASTPYDETSRSIHW
jgi:hypothetical protein